MSDKWLEPALRRGIFGLSFVSRLPLWGNCTHNETGVQPKDVGIIEEIQQRRAIMPLWHSVCLQYNINVRS